MSRAMTKPLASRIALVTGASRGIGYATALALAKAGAHIVAVARTQGGLEELDDAIRAEGGSATLVPLNITDLDGLSRLGAALHERHGKLDILVGNAGVAGPSSPLGHIELKAWNDTMATNLTANFQLIRCMEPLLQQSDAGPRRVPHIRHRQQGLRLSRPLCRLQGCAGNAGARLGQRDRHDEYPRQPVQSRPDPHAYARHRDARRRSRNARHAGTGCRDHRAAVPAVMDRDREVRMTTRPAR
jgi:NAD(P)-dependent dehydrogenase (short-subunit alcohol dehydrogenase family)